MFMSTYERAEAYPGSGDGPQDIMNDALATYEIDHPKGQAFNNVSSWELLKKNVKFKEVNWSCAAMGKGNNSSNDETDDRDSAIGRVIGESSCHNQEDRPMGHKRAKKEEADKKLHSKVIDFMETNAQMQKDRKVFLEMLTSAYILSMSADFDEDREETMAFFRNARRTIFQNQVQHTPTSNPTIVGPHPHVSEPASIPHQVYHSASPLSPNFCDQHPPPLPTVHFHQCLTSMANQFHHNGPSIPTSFLATRDGSSVGVGLDQGIHYGGNLHPDPFDLRL